MRKVGKRMEKKTKIVVATHGKLAEGFKSAMNIIAGDTTEVKFLSCYTTPDFDMEETVQQVFKETDFEHENLLVCTDLFGGSVCNWFMKHYNDHPFFLVANVNLGILVDFLLTGEELNVELLREKCNSDLHKPVEVSSKMEDIEQDDL